MATSSIPDEHQTPRSLGKQINHIARAIRWIADYELKETQLTTATYFIIRIIHGNPGITQNELSRELQTDKATAAKSVAKLESIGYLKRTPDPQDGRVRRLYLTEKGKNIIPSVQGVLKRVTEISAQNLRPSELEQLFSLLDRVEDAVTGYVSREKGEYNNP